MHLFYCDETNLQDHNQFLIYGGLAIPEENASDLSNSVEMIRREAGIDNQCQLKFKPTPDNLDHFEFIDVKQAIIETAIDHGCKLFTSMIHHQIIKKGDINLARRREINRVILNFHDYLGQDNGMVLLDRFDDKEIDNHLREKFSVGLQGLPHGTMRLDNILGFHYSTIGQSHFPSVIDIILGSFRFAVNAYTLKQDDLIETACTLLELLNPLFIRNSHDQITRSGLNFSPKVVKVGSYRRDYKNLQDFLEQNGLKTEQKIRSRVSRSTYK